MGSNTIGNVNSGNQNDMFHQGSGCMNFCNLRTKDAHAQTYLQKKKTQVGRAVTASQGELLQLQRLSDQILGSFCSL